MRRCRCLSILCPTVLNIIPLREPLWLEVQGSKKTQADRASSQRRFEAEQLRNRGHHRAMFLNAKAFISPEG